jgi:hypothetical protein
LFVVAEEEVSDELLIYIATSVKQSWETSLKVKFPERSFQVVLENFLNDPEDRELILYFFENEV